MSQYNDNTNCFNNTNTFNNVWNNYTGTDGSQLLAWLSPLEPRLRHQDVQDRRVEDVGEWLLQTEEFRSWHDWSGGGDCDNAVLFCYGDPGVGKTFISSLVVDRLGDQASGQNTAVACFYFDFAARKEQSATSMLGSLVKQVIGGMERIPEEIMRVFQEQKKIIGGRGPRLLEIVKMLQTITSSQRTFICIDALDECAPVHRVKILESLKKILDKSPGTRIFVTGRPHIRAEIKRRLAGRVISVSIGASKDDIITYLRVRLDEDETPDAMDESLEADILREVPENISEMFLLVSLNIEAILQESTIHRRRQKLSAMTNGLGLGYAYGATIERIKAQDGDKSRLGMAALMWISHAERPLQADELCHALAVELGSMDFYSQNVPSISTLVNCCQGLITVDKEGSIVRLIHFTLQEYLSANPDIFIRPHSTIAEICLTYLNSRQVKALSTDPSPNLQDTPFLRYCSIYWGVHAKRELSECAKSLALKLFEDYDGHISTKLLLEQVRYSLLEDGETYSPFTGLHCSSFFGIVEVVDVYLEMKCYDINEGDFGGLTPLAWAAYNGHEETAKILLGREEVNPDKPNNEGRTPLLFAASNGHEGVMKMLLGREEVNPDKPDIDGGTPLSFAAGGGHDGSVKVLLGRGVNPKKVNKWCRSPLSYAAENGHEEVVKTLLAREDVNRDDRDYTGRTPLSYAANDGHEGVVEILLGCEEVDPDKEDIWGRTPLSFTAEKGHEGVLKILLERKEVNPNKADNGSRTPLLFAAEFGYDGLVKILLGREEVDPDKANKWGRTPLFLAAQNGHDEVVKLLLARGEVNRDEPDTTGRTPLSRAAENGHVGAIKILLGCKEVNPDKGNTRGRTPLSYAAENGHEGVVKILLGREEVNPDKENTWGRTPLSYAAENGHEGVVGIFLGRREVSPDKPDVSGGTPLLFAAWRGHAKVVKILLGREEVNPDKLNNDGRAPLSYAAEQGHEEVVKMLLGREEVNPDRPDNLGATPLSSAAENGHEGVVKILLELEQVNPDKPDNEGETPLSLASMYDHEGVVALLQSRKSATPSGA